jgi:hypothetical protein
MRSVVMVRKWSRETRDEFYGLVGGGWSVRAAAAAVGVSRTTGGLLVGQVCAHGTSFCLWTGRGTGGVAAVDTAVVDSEPAAAGSGGGGAGTSAVEQ